MEKQTSKAILVVNFGTSYKETREKTIDAIRWDIESAFKGYRIYEAWTSGIIAQILEKRDGIHKNSVDEAFRQMIEEGVEEVFVQPTFIIKGIEYNKMLDSAEGFRNELKSIEIGEPLLGGYEDFQQVGEILRRNLKSEGAVLLMGHGSTHLENYSYEKMNEVFATKGMKDFYMATVEGGSSMESILQRLKEASCEKVLLAPFMIVAGDHAMNDMAGDEDSWKTQLEARGYQVTCLLKGLGEYPEIRKIFVNHLRITIRGR